MVWGLVLGLTAAVLVGFGLVRTSQYGSVAKPGLLIGAVEVGGFDLVQLRRTITEVAAEARVEVGFGDVSHSASLAQLGVTVDLPATLAAVLAGEPGVGLIGPALGQSVVPLKLEIDRTIMSQWVGAYQSGYAEPPRDASIRFDAQSGQFIVVPSQSGQVFDLAPLERAVAQVAVRPDQPAHCDLRLVAATPAIADAAALTAADSANSRLRLTINLTDQATSLYLVTASDIAAWTVVRPDPELGLIELSYDPVLVAAGLSERLRSQVEAAALPRRVVTDQADQVIAVPQDGRQGRSLGDLTQAAQAIATGLERGLSLDAPVPIQRQDFDTVTSQLSGPPPTSGKWIDVDLSAQTTNLFVGRELVASYVVSSGLPQTPTLTGTFHVYTHVRSQTMTGGSKADGTDYSIPNVTWVTYYDGNYGFHTAYWLDESQIGQPQSHGCLNMREAEAKFLYDWAPNGTTVVVHE
ncbi:MAG: L,D-transpeptidase [Propionibacteriaceae bacterium]|nr:L,D-transpeptidase [Propionibacteriaceae bacterium]